MRANQVIDEILSKFYSNVADIHIEKSKKIGMPRKTITEEVNTFTLGDIYEYHESQLERI